MRHNSAELICEFEKSGLSQKAFCAAQSISPSALQYHLRKQRRDAESGEGRFIALQRTQYQSGSEPLVIICRNLSTERIAEHVFELENSRC